jgi:hypothetical protein
MTIGYTGKNGLTNWKDERLQEQLLHNKKDRRKQAGFVHDQDDETGPRDIRATYILCAALQITLVTAPCLGGHDSCPVFHPIVTRDLLSEVKSGSWSYQLCQG